MIIALAPDGRQWLVPIVPVAPGLLVWGGLAITWGGDPVGWGISATVPVPVTWGGEPVTWGGEPVTWGRI
jgi:hypothetical protein